MHHFVRPACAQHDVELVDAIEVLGLGDEHDLGVAAGAHEAEGLQQMVGAEVLAGGEELLLVARRARRRPGGARQDRPSGRCT